MLPSGLSPHSGATTRDTTLSELSAKSKLSVQFDSQPDETMHLTITLLPTGSKSGTFDRCPHLGSDTLASFDNTPVPVVTYGYGEIGSGPGSPAETHCAPPLFEASLPQDRLPIESTTTFRLSDHTASLSVQLDDVFQLRSLSLVTPADGQIAPGASVELSWSAPASEALDRDVWFGIEAAPDPAAPTEFNVGAILSLSSTPSTHTFAPTAEGIAFVFPNLKVMAPARLEFDHSVHPPCHDCVGQATCEGSLYYERRVPITILPSP